MYSRMGPPHEAPSDCNPKLGRSSAASPRQTSAKRLTAETFQLYTSERGSHTWSNWSNNGRYWASFAASRGPLGPLEGLRALRHQGRLGHIGSFLEPS